MPVRKSAPGPRKAWSFDPRQKTWSWDPYGARVCCVQGADAAVVVDGRRLDAPRAGSVDVRDTGRTRDALGSREVVEVEFAFEAPRVALILRVGLPRNRRMLYVQAVVRNDGTAPKRLDACELVRALPRRGGGMALGPQPGEVRWFGYQPWRTRIERVGARPARHTTGLIGQVYNPTAGQGLNHSFVTFDRLRGYQELGYSRGGRPRPFRAVCDFSEHCLPAGGSIATEMLRLVQFQDPYAALEDWADAAAAVYRPRLPAETPAGWSGMAWRCGRSQGCLSAREDLLRNADAIRRRLPALGVDYLWTSLGGLKGVMPGNWFDVNRSQPPREVKQFLGELRKRGFKPMLWVVPFWIYRQARVAWQANRDNFLRLDGEPACRPRYLPFTNQAQREDERFGCSPLDGTHPATHAFLRKVFDAYRRMGVRYYMLDFLGCGKGLEQHDPCACAPVERDRAVMHTIRKAAGPHTHLLTAVNSNLGYTGCVDAMRVNTDYGEGRPIGSSPPRFDNATFLVHDRWFSNHRRLLRNAAAQYFVHRRLCINDCNFVTVSKPVPRHDAEVTATTFGLTGSPVMLGDDIERISDERLAIIKKILPRTPQTARPADLFARTGPDNYPRVLVLPVDTGWDRYVVVGVFNFEDRMGSIELDARMLGLRARRWHVVWDFWDEAYVGRFRDAITCEVPAGSCRLWRVSAARRHPWLVGSDMHVLGGQVEVGALAWDPQTRTLTGSASRPTGEQGSLYFALPPTYRLLDPCGHWLAKDARDETTILRRRFDFDRPRKRFTLRFAQAKRQ